MEHTLSEAIAPFLQAGLLGSLCIIFGIVIIFLWREARADRRQLAAEAKTEREEIVKMHKSERDALLKECREERLSLVAQITASYEQRVEDSKITQQQMLETVKQCTTAITTNSAAIDASHETQNELKHLIQDLNNLFRERER